MRVGAKARSVASEVAGERDGVPAPPVRLTDRAVWVLVTSWRDIADRYAEEGREDSAWAFRHAATALEQQAGFCAVCTGQGEVYEAPEEDDESGWSWCSMCSGSGLQRLAHLCSGCGLLHREPDISEVAPGEWKCTSCVVHAKTMRRYGAEPVSPRWFCPLGESV